jgi:hypothetical protein
MESYFTSRIVNPKKLYSEIPNIFKYQKIEYYFNPISVKMKYKIILLTFFIPFLGICQSKPYYKQTITAYEIKKKDTISKKVMVTHLDSIRKIITTENNILNAISASVYKRDKTHSIIEVNTDRLYISTDINSKGDTIGKVIYVYDEKKNRTENYQILNGDTLNGQKRSYNKSGKYTKLYNKYKDSHKYYLSNKWKYDSNGNTLKSQTYDQNGKLVGIEKFKNIYKKDEFISTRSESLNGKEFIIKSKEIKKGNVRTIYFYYNSFGFNYGIKINHVSGGYSIEEEDSEGNMKELRIYDNQNNMTAFVKNVEVKFD